MNKQLYVAIAAALGSANAFAAGSIVFDNTLPGQPHGTTTTVPLVNGGYTIDASNTGYLSGRNLFESFTTFTVASGETASFTNSTNLSIGNVVSRVTGIGSPNGLQPTTINGNLVSTIQGANFWFINPAGVTIGAGATINVPAGLAIGSADYIQFADNSRWYALESSAPTPSVLATASPAAFGFLPATTAGALSIQAAALNSAAGGSVTLASGAPLTIGTTTTPVSISTGPIGVSTPGTSGAVTMLSPSSVALTNATVATGGAITITSGAAGVTLTNSALTSTDGSGVPGSTSTTQLAISSAGGPVVLQSSSVLTTNIPIMQTGQTPSAPANISIAGDSIAVHGGGAVSQTHNVTDAGGITLTATGNSATAIQIDGGATLESRTGNNPTEEGGGTGAISLQAAAGGIAVSGGSISTITGEDEGNATADAGQPGPISLTAQQISLAAGSLIEVRDNSVGGTPAPISLSASGQISIVGSALEETSLSQGLQTGDIDMTAASVLLNGATLDTLRGYYGSQSGDINITASAGHGTGVQEPLLIEGGSTLDANGAFGGSGGGGLFGYAGNISLSAPSGAIRVADSTLTAENNGGTTSGRGFINVTAGSTLTVDSSTIESTTGQAGNGGSLPPDSITLQSGGPLFISATTISDISPSAQGIVYGTGGDVTISAPSILISGGSIETTTYGQGAAGSVLISASGTSGVGPAQGGTGDAVLIKGGAAIGSQVSGYYDCCGGIDLGPAGNVTINAPAGSIRIQQSTLSTDTAYGQAGVISLSGGTGVTLDGATLLSRMLAGGSAGTPPADIALQSSGPITITSGTSIDSSTNGDTPAGRISVTTPEALVVSGESSLTSTTGGSPNDGPFGTPNGGSGQAGSITLTGGSLLVTGGTISVSTTGAGPANTVTLVASGRDIPGSAALTVDGGAVIESNASGAGIDANAGFVKLSAPSGTVQVGLAADGVASSLSTSVGVNAGTAGEVTVTGAGVDLQKASISTTTASVNPSATRGTITLDAGNGSGPLTIANSTLDATTSGVQQAGEIDLLGSPIVISNSTILSATTGAGSAGAICVGDPGCVATGAVVPATGGSIAIGGSTLSTSTDTAGTAGDIQVNGRLVSVSGGHLSASTTGTGKAGNVSLTATGASGANGAAALEVSGGASINSDASEGTSPQADAGYVKLAAPSGTVQVGLATDSAPSSLSTSAGVNAGAAGAVTITGAAIELGDAKILTTTASTQPSTTRGTIVLDAGQGAGPLTISNSSLDATTSGVQQAGEIDLLGSPIVISNSMILSATTGAGSAGAICVGDPGCVAGAVVPATGGSIAISGSTLSTSTDTAGTAGDIQVNGRSVSVSGGHLSASTTGTGKAGNVSLTATGASGANGAAALEVSGGASINSDASEGTSPQADAGYVKLTASNGTVQVGLSGDTAQTALSTSAGASAGSAGAVTILGAAIDLGDALVATTAAGAIPSATRGSIVLDADNGAGPLTIANSTLNATTSGVQQAGEIDLQGAPIVISNSTISSKTSGTGAAGAICVSSTGSASCVPAAAAAAGAADQRRLSIIHAGSPSTGSIAINGSTLSTSTSTSGNAGNINVTTTGALALSDATIESQSTSPSATNAGSVGVINLTAGSFSMTDHSLVSATSVGAHTGTPAPGATTPATAITISSTGGSSPLLIAQSTVDASAGLANGSNIVVNAGGSPIRLQGSTILASAKAGNGGNITINDAGTTTLQQTGILAQAGPGNGGAINIGLKAGALFVQDAQSLVSATSQSGNNGTVTISAPQTNFQSSLYIPQVSAAKAPELSANACQRDTGHSTFVREGRGGVTPGPDDYLAGRPASELPAAGESAHQSGDTAPGLVASTAAATPAGCP